MKILSIRSEKPVAEIGLYSDGKRVAYESWPAHRQLAETLHKKIHDLLISNQLEWKDLEGIVCYKGPGSFTGLRIGLSAANAIAAGLGVPIVAEQGTQWQLVGCRRLQEGDVNTVVLPEYGAPVRTTPPKK